MSIPAVQSAVWRGTPEASIEVIRSVFNQGGVSRMLPSVALTRIDAGLALLGSRGTAVSVTAGDVIVQPAFDVLQFVVDAPAPLVATTLEFRAPWAQELRKGGMVLRSRRVSTILDLVLSRVGEPDQELPDTMLQSLVWAVSSEIAVLPGPVASAIEPAVVRTMRERLFADSHRNVTLDELAAEVGMSKFYVARLFADTLGIAPHKYQTAVRVARALELLRSGSEPRKVATAVGFADHSHMARHFRKGLGVSPSVYRHAASSYLNSLVGLQTEQLLTLCDQQAHSSRLRVGVRSLIAHALRDRS